MSKVEKAADIAALSFEQGIKELEGIVKRLESGSGDLEQAIADYTRGAQLREHCQKKLEEAKLKVEKIVKNGDNITLAPFEAEKQ